MSKEDLIPLNKRPKGEADLIRMRGGKAKGKGKSNGAKLRQIKARIAKGIDDPKDREWMMEKITNRDACASDIMLYIHEIRKQLQNPDQMIKLGNLMTSVGRFHHGDRIQVENKNINLNIDIPVDEVKEHLRKVLGKEVD